VLELEAEPGGAPLPSGSDRQATRALEEQASRFAHLCLAGAVPALVPGPGGLLRRSKSVACRARTVAPGRVLVDVTVETASLEAGLLSGAAASGLALPRPCAALAGALGCGGPCFTVLVRPPGAVVTRIVTGFPTLDLADAGGFSPAFIAAVVALLEVVGQTALAVTPCLVAMPPSGPMPVAPLQRVAARVLLRATPNKPVPEEVGPFVLPGRAPFTLHLRPPAAPPRGYPAAPRAAAAGGGAGPRGGPASYAAAAQQGSGPALAPEWAAAMQAAAAAAASRFSPPAMAPAEVGARPGPGLAAAAAAPPPIPAVLNGAPGGEPFLSLPPLALAQQALDRQRLQHVAAEVAAAEAAAEAVAGAAAGAAAETAADGAAGAAGAVGALGGGGTSDGAVPQEDMALGEAGGSPSPSGGAGGGLPAGAAAAGGADAGGHPLGLPASGEGSEDPIEEAMSGCEEAPPLKGHQHQPKPPRSQRNAPEHERQRDVKEKNAQAEKAEKARQAEATKRAAREAQLGLHRSNRFTPLVTENLSEERRGREAAHAAAEAAALAGGADPVAAEAAGFRAPEAFAEEAAAARVAGGAGAGAAAAPDGGAQA
jgi:hypothetical protein